MRRYGLEAQAGAALTGNALALLSLVGRWDEAERLSDEVLGANIPDAQARHVHLARAKLELARGRLAVARIHLDRAYPPEVLDQTHQLLTAELHSTEAELALEGGHLDDARRWAAKALDNLSPAEHGRIVIQLCRLGLQIEADIAERNLSLKTPDALGEPHREFLAGTLAAATASAGPDVRAHQATAAAEYRRSLLTSDPKAWAAAAAAWEALHRKPDEAYCQLRRAEAELDVARSRRAAAGPLRRAYRVALELGADSLLRRAVDLARRSRIALETPAPDPRAEPATRARHTAAPGNGLGITRREFDVLRELANGSSNREIADQLFISTRTVAVHVFNLLTKLGVSRRGQAAAAATRLGLIDE